MAQEKKFNMLAAMTAMGIKTVKVVGCEYKEGKLVREFAVLVEWLDGNETYIPPRKELASLVMQETQCTKLMKEVENAELKLISLYKGEKKNEQN